MFRDDKGQEEDGTAVFLRRPENGTLEAASLTRRSRISAAAGEEWRTVGDEMQYALAQSHSHTSKQTHINTLVSSAKSITTSLPSPPEPPQRPKTTRKLFYLAPHSKLRSLPGKLINPPFENPETKERKTKHYQSMKIDN